MSCYCLVSTCALVMLINYIEVDFSETDGNTAIVSLLPPIDHVSTLEVGKCFEDLLS